MRKKLFYFLILPLLVSSFVAVILHILISQYFIRDAKDDIESILLSNRGFHQYIQRVLHPTFFQAMEHGYISKDFYVPQALSSTYIVRTMHSLYNEERKTRGLRPVYYKLAANNPRNPVNKADEWEAKKIRLFNENPEIKEQQEIVTVNGQKYLYYAVPFLKNQQHCLRCHGEPEDAPVGLRKMYPGEGGFHEKLGEIRAIESMRIPIAQEGYAAIMLAGSAGSGLFALIVLFFFSAGLRQRVKEKTQSLQAEIAERVKAQNMLQAIVDTEPECVKMLDKDANLIMMNAAGLSMLDADSLDQVKGQCVLPLIVPEYREAFMELTESIFRGEAGALLFEMVGLKGRRLWLDTHAVPFRNEKKEIISMLGVTRNVTERRQAENALAEEKERLAVTLRSIGDGVIVTDTSGRITLLNKVGEELTGWRCEEAIGKPLTDVFSIIDEKTRKKCENPVEKVIDTGMIIGLANHTALIRKDGTEIIIADSGAPIMDKESKIIGVVLVFRDITAQYRMEQEMQKMEKLESLGILAGGLAHDFNNLLTSIMGNVSLAKMQIGIDHKSFESLTDAEKAAKRATDLTHQLLTFAKGGAPIKKIVSIAEIVKEAVGFALSGSSVNCVYSVPANLWVTEVDKGQMTQVFNNLIINSVQAMPNGGAVKIGFENISINEEEVPSLPAGDYVKITFGDKGVGIPEEQLDKIFDPYFTTKATGSGLGLSSVFSVLKRHEGHISVQSKTGAGTTFTLYIPAIKNVVSPESYETAAVKFGREKILIMDDEPTIRDMTGKILTVLGYEVDFAKDGKEAIDIYRKADEEGNPFDLVIMDLTVPGGMGGTAAVGKLHEIAPHAKVIVSSGYSTDPIMSEYKKYGFCGVIIKPYSANQVSEAIRNVLKGKAAGS